MQVIFGPARRDALLSLSSLTSVGGSQCRSIKTQHEMGAKMIRGSEVRRADHPLDATFVDRWSSRVMSDEGLKTQELMVLFEAARWAPSAFNAQRGVCATPIGTAVTGGCSRSASTRGISHGQRMPVRWCYLYRRRRMTGLEKGRKHTRAIRAPHGDSSHSRGT